MKVAELKELLAGWLDTLEQYEDTDNVKMVGNTYFLGGAKYFLGVAGYDGGYINLAYLDESIQFEDEE